MDESKIRAIVDWELPTKVTELRYFLGLANYYQRFIEGYSKITAPLTNLLKKGKAFTQVKQVMTRKLILTLSDYSKPYEVHMNASEYAIGGVLMQDEHPVAFESQKLNETEFVVFTNNVANSYFLTQKKLSSKQARWQIFLVEFDLPMEYKSRSANTVADALS
ncbi:polyprotein [Gossypium australe]|uniref:Polyprotein n=1 Tax=Gossypium australe TaxID=47621 RepID=A0A5B6U8P1_9ROSI|nr:polyprotein [Gossypium australe]